MSKTVYIVGGSEDGLLGVFGNVKKAYEVAKNYCESGSNSHEPIVTSYSQACKKLRNYYTSIDMKEPWSESNASITSAPFNKEAQ